MYADPSILKGCNFNNDKRFFGSFFVVERIGPHNVKCDAFMETYVRFIKVFKIFMRYE